MGRGQNLVGGILIGTRLAMRLAGHFAPFSDRSRCHRRREPKARDGRGCIIYLLAVAEPRHHGAIVLTPPEDGAAAHIEIGRASCRERVCQYVYMSVVAVSFKKNTILIPKAKTTKIHT